MSQPWRQYTRAVLRRDPVCVVCGTRPSVEVDHIVPRVMGGSHELDNLRGVCVACHRGLTRALADRRARGPRARIVREW